MYILQVPGLFLSSVLPVNVHMIERVVAVASNWHAAARPEHGGAHAHTGEISDFSRAMGITGDGEHIKGTRLT